MLLLQPEHIYVIQLKILLIFSDKTYVKILV